MCRPDCCEAPNHRPLYSFKVPFSGEHIRVLFCYSCRWQYEVDVPKPGERIIEVAA